MSVYLDSLMESAAAALVGREVEVKWSSLVKEGCYGRATEDNQIVLDDGLTGDLLEHVFLHEVGHCTHWRDAVKRRGETTVRSTANKGTVTQHNISENIAERRAKQWRRWADEKVKALGWESSTCSRLLALTLYWSDTQ